jgi:hypothetical protein
LTARRLKAGGWRLAILRFSPFKIPLDFFEEIL